MHPYCYPSWKRLAHFLNHTNLPQKPAKRVGETIHHSPALALRIRESLGVMLRLLSLLAWHWRNIVDMHVNFKELQGTYVCKSFRSRQPSNTQTSASRHQKFHDDIDWFNWYQYWRIHVGCTKLKCVTFRSMSLIHETLKHNCNMFCSHRVIKRVVTSIPLLHGNFTHQCHMCGPSLPLAPHQIPSGSRTGHSHNREVKRLNMVKCFCLLNRTLTQIGSYNAVCLTMAKIASR